MIDLSAARTSPAFFLELDRFFASRAAQTRYLVVNHGLKLSRLGVRLRQLICGGLVYVERRWNALEGLLKGEGRTFQVGAEQETQLLVALGLNRDHPTPQVYALDVEPMDAREVAAVFDGDTCVSYEDSRLLWSAKPERHAQAEPAGRNQVRTPGKSWVQNPEAE